MRYLADWIYKIEKHMKPSHVRLLELATNYQYSAMVYTLAKLDVMDILS